MGGAVNLHGKRLRRKSLPKAWRKEKPGFDPYREAKRIKKTGAVGFQERAFFPVP